MDRTASRFALRTVAWATVPMLLLVSCSGDGGEAGETDDEPSSAASPSPEPVRFADLPAPCSLLTKNQVREVVPKASPIGGQALSSQDTSSSASCLWNGLDTYQFRSLTVWLKRFESDPSTGSGDERAEEFSRQQIEEIAADDANDDVSEEELADVGDEATSIGYLAVLEGEDEEQDYRQQRVVARAGNVVVTIDYAGTGFEGADLPSAGAIREAADTAATAAVAALESAAEGGEDGEGESTEEEQEGSADDADGADGD